MGERGNVEPDVGSVPFRSYMVFNISTAVLESPRTMLFGSGFFAMLALHSTVLFTVEPQRCEVAKVKTAAYRQSLTASGPALLPAGFSGWGDIPIKGLHGAQSQKSPPNVPPAVPAILIPSPTRFHARRPKRGPCSCEISYRLRRENANPARPRPRSASEPGSGTTTDTSSTITNAGLFRADIESHEVVPVASIVREN